MYYYFGLMLKNAVLGNNKINRCAKMNGTVTGDILAEHLLWIVLGIEVTCYVLIRQVVVHLLVVLRTRLGNHGEAGGKQMLMEQL